MLLDFADILQVKCSRFGNLLDRRILPHPAPCPLTDGIFGQIALVSCRVSHFFAVSLFLRKKYCDKLEFLFSDRRIRAGKNVLATVQGTVPQKYSSSG